jgi:hypothetical protein
MGPSRICPTPDDSGREARQDVAVGPTDIIRLLEQIERETAVKLGLDLVANSTPATALREYVAACERVGPTVEMKVALPTAHSEGLLHALAERYGLPAYRRPRQKYTSVTVSGPERALREAFAPMLQEMSSALDRWFMMQTQEVLHEFEKSRESPMIRKLAQDLGYRVDR